MQHDLFPPDPAAAPATQAGLFVDVVFDRPLDHAFTYAVGEGLRDAVAVGKRVRVPFGRGDRAAVGYCVGVSDQPPARAVKEVLAVLDEEALLTDDLLRLTRWMADYYLCGWGQVLNAVVPAGAREGAGTRSQVFLEAVPEAELPSPAPELTAKQSAVLARLREAGRPVEARQLQRQAGSGPGPVQALLAKGLARRVRRRVDRFNAPAEAPQVEEPVTLNDDQARAWAALEPALREGGFR